MCVCSNTCTVHDLHPQETFGTGNGMPSLSSSLGQSQSCTSSSAIIHTALTLIVNLLMDAHAHPHSHTHTHKHTHTHSLTDTHTHTHAHSLRHRYTHKHIHTHARVHTLTCPSL